MYMRNVKSNLLENLLVFLIELLTLLLFVVLAANLLNLLYNAFNIVLVLVGLCLIHVDLTSHFLEFAGLGVEALLKNREFLCSFKAWLFLHDFANFLNLLLFLVY